MSRVEMKIEKSRFAALKIENDDETGGSWEVASKSKNGSSKNKITSNGGKTATSNLQQQQQQQAKSKNKPKKKSNSESSSSGSCLSAGMQSEKPISEQDWQTWKEKDEEVERKRESTILKPISFTRLIFLLLLLL